MAINRELSQFASFVEVDNTSRKIGFSTDLAVTGIITATKFYGSGRFLTDVLAEAIPSGTKNQLQYNNNELTTGGAEIYYNSSTQNVGIGSSTPTSKLTVIGNVSVSGVITCTDLNSASDIKLKENIKTIENSLETINKLRGVSFDWKESGKSSYGVIAQELQEILPDLVSDGETKSVSYNGLIGILIEVVKELSKEIEELKKTK